jgi:predicted nucleic acid-binding protein
VIVVDTSVWVAVLRDPGSEHAATLSALLDADDVALPVPVRSELLMGSPQQARPRLQAALTALPVLYPTEATWRRVDAWAALARRRGETFGLVDLLVGVLAEELGALVWSLDGDFARLGALTLVQCYR